MSQKVNSTTNPTTFSRFLFHHNLTFSPPPSLPNVADLWQANGTPSWSSSRALRKEAPLPEIQRNFRWKKDDVICHIFPRKKNETWNLKTIFPWKSKIIFHPTPFLGIQNLSFWVCRFRWRPGFPLPNATPVLTTRLLRTIYLRSHLSKAMRCEPCNKKVLTKQGPGMSK